MCSRLALLFSAGYYPDWCVDKPDGLSGWRTVCTIVVPGERTHNGANLLIRQRQAMEGDGHWVEGISVALSRAGHTARPEHGPVPASA